MKVAILKGGNHRHQESLDSAKNIFADLLDKMEVDDVYLDKDNKWYVKGIKTEPHFVLPHYDHIIDTTHVKDHSQLMRKLGVSNVLDHELSISNYRKILKQSHIKTPDHHVYKTGEEIHSKLFDSWRNLHLPIVVKGVNKISPKLIAYNPNEIIEHANFIFQKNEDVVLENFIRGRTYHILTISNFRQNNIYKSIILESIQKKNFKEFVRAVSLSEKKRKELEKLSEDVHNLLGLRLSKLDFVMSAKGNFYLVDISNKLNFREGGATHSLFKNSGISLAEYISGL
jgi:D-alanine-D-alanine ligase-like ATP-grasp enzyme